jgi:hypothetical protein
MLRTTRRNSGEDGDREGRSIERRRPRLISGNHPSERPGGVQEARLESCPTPIKMRFFATVLLGQKTVEETDAQLVPSTTPILAGIDVRGIPPANITGQAFEAITSSSRESFFS